MDDNNEKMYHSTSTIGTCKVPSCFISNIRGNYSRGTVVYFLKDKIQLGSRDPLMLAYFEQIMNGVVYELYFPEEDRLQRLRTLFEILYDGTHPIRITIAKLQTFDTARIIEGKA